jgi:hypothetical protein
LAWCSAMNIKGDNQRREYASQDVLSAETGAIPLHRATDATNPHFSQGGTGY